SCFAGAGLGGGGMVERGRGASLGKPAPLPGGRAGVEPRGAEGVSSGELLDARAADAAPPPEVAHVTELLPPPKRGRVGEGVCGILIPTQRWLKAIAVRHLTGGGMRWCKQMRVQLGGDAVAHRDEALHLDLAQSIDLAKPKTQRKGAVSRLLERAVPQTVVDVGRARLDAMSARASHDLRRCIKAHRLRVEQRRAKCRGVMAFDPGRDIHKVGEARGMTLGETILAEALDLVEAALGELCRITALRHMADHLLAQAVNGAAAAEGRHGTAEFVRLGA